WKGRGGGSAPIVPPAIMGIGRTELRPPCATCSPLGTPLLQALENLLAPYWRCSARTVTLRAEPRSPREPAGHSAAALANWTLVVGILSIRDHTPEYKAKMRQREAERPAFF